MDNEKDSQSQISNQLSTINYQLSISFPSSLANRLQIVVN